MQALSLTSRLRQALTAELPPDASSGLDAQLVEHLASQLSSGGGDGEDEEALTEAWSPFLVSLGACQDDAGAKVVCGRVLARLRRPDGAPAGAPAAGPAAGGAGGASGADGGGASPSRPKAAATSAPAADDEEDELPEEIAAWLEKLRLVGYMAQARSWCHRMGAVLVGEVLEHWEEFADDLKLKPLERKRVEKAKAAGSDAGAAASAAAARGAGASAASAAPAGGAAAAAAGGGAGAGAAAGGATGPAAASAAAGAVAPAAPPAPRANVTGYFGPPDDPRRYTMLEELGQGATATVYRCTRGSETFAVKTISLAKLRLQPGFQRIADKMRREVSILFALRHPRIVSLFDVVEVPDSAKPEKLHLVMELVQGGELFDKIVERGSFRESVARYVFLQITEGLKYVHSKDIVYRDLKPENILVDEQKSRSDLFEVKLSDFGHSKLINDGYSTALTRVGTPQYWAPEVSDPMKAARGYDQTVDLWSLGVVLYVMLIGAYPFDGIGLPIEEQIRRANVQFRINALGLEISDQAKELIRALIKVKPSDRLTLDKCLCHPWVSSEGGSISRMLKLCTEVNPRTIEERIRLPVHPSKDQVDTLRRDLVTWMTKFRCSAKLMNDEIIASLGDEAAEGHAFIESARKELRMIVEYNFGTAGSSPAAAGQPSRGATRGGYPSQLSPVNEEGGKGSGRSFRLLTFTLRVHAEHGAGLDLNPEKGGMRVEMIYEVPGQPGLQSGDLITKIQEVSLRGTPDNVEEIFGRHFCDGAEIAVRRGC